MERAVVVCCLVVVFASIFWNVRACDESKAYDLGALTALVIQIQMKMEAQEIKIQAQENQIQALENKMEAMEAPGNNTEAQGNKIVALENKIASLQKAREKNNDGFTVVGIKEVSSTGVMTFHKVYINMDNSYNKATGVFTCKTPGFYYFTASLIKKYSYAKFAACFIHKNGNYIVQAYTYPGTSTHEGNVAAVNGAYTHLTTGDTVTLGECSMTDSWDTIYTHSSFSGFLITPDAA